MNPSETYRLDRLYHQFLKPKGGRREQLPSLVTRLSDAGFIKTLQDRYEETQKLRSKENQKELFKLVQGVVNEKPNSDL